MADPPPERKPEGQSHDAHIATEGFGRVLPCTWRGHLSNGQSVVGRNPSTRGGGQSLAGNAPDADGRSRAAFCRDVRSCRVLGVLEWGSPHDQPENTTRGLRAGPETQPRRTTGRVPGWVACRSIRVGPERILVETFMARAARGQTSPANRDPWTWRMAPRLAVLGFFRPRRVSQEELDADNRPASRQAHLRSHSGRNAGVVFSHAPTAAECTVPPHLFRVLLLERFAAPLAADRGNVQRVSRAVGPTGKTQECMHALGTRQEEGATHWTDACTCVQGGRGTREVQMRTCATWTWASGALTRGASRCLHRICLASKGPSWQSTSPYGALSVLLRRPNLEPRRRTGQCLSRLAERRRPHTRSYWPRDDADSSWSRSRPEGDGATRRRNFSGSSHWPRHARLQQCWLAPLHSPGSVGGCGCSERHTQSLSQNRWWHQMSPTHDVRQEECSCHTTRDSGSDYSSHGETRRRIHEVHWWTIHLHVAQKKYDILFLWYFFTFFTTRFQSDYFFKKRSIFISINSFYLRFHFRLWNIIEEHFHLYVLYLMMIFSHETVYEWNLKKYIYDHIWFTKKNRKKK